MTQRRQRDSGAGALIASSVIVVRYFKGNYNPYNELLYGAYVTMPLTLMLLVGGFLPSKSATGEHGTHVNGQSQGKAPLHELTVFLAVTLITLTSSSFLGKGSRTTQC